MSKQKGKGQQTQQAGVYKSESVRDVAESIGITNLPESVASMLASDIEYRIHQVVEEAARFMRHSHRTSMTTSDIDQALRVLNIEPLYGHSAHNPPSFRRAQPFPQLPQAGQVYFVEDEEVDFDRVIKEEKVTLPKPVRWKSHWLAVEGVQPLIPENPPAIPKETDEEKAGKAGSPPRNSTIFPPTPPSPGRSQVSKKQQQLLVKQVLSRELQLYYSRLTTALMPPVPAEHAKRTAALASLRHDAGLQALLPYLIRWVGEGVVLILKDGGQNEQDGRALEVYLDVIGALLDNSSMFVEPYLHQLLPPILSILLHSSLPPSHSTHLRTSASQILSHLLTGHSTTYPSLSPRIMKTLLVALVAADKSKGTREGAIRGLIAVGKEAIRKGLVDSGGARVVGSECASAEASPIVDAVMDAFKVLAPPSESPTPLDPSSEEGGKLSARLREALGDFFADRLLGDVDWTRGIIGIKHE